VLYREFVVRSVCSHGVGCYVGVCKAHSGVVYGSRNVVGNEHVGSYGYVVTCMYVLRYVVVM